MPATCTSSTNVLGVLTLTAAIATGTPGATVAFTEPAEQAYIVQVPYGWHATGGVVRKSPMNVRPWLSVTSGATTLFMGDPDPDFASVYYVKPKSPAPALPQDAVQAPYENGSAFAAEYGLKTLPQRCTDVRLVSTQAEPALVALVRSRQAAFLQDELQAAKPVMAEWLREHPSSPSLDGGSALFACRIGTKPFAARISSVTMLVPGPLFTIWAVNALQGFIAPADLADDAAKYLTGISTSYRNDSWRKNQADEAAYKLSKNLQPSTMRRYQQLARFLEQKPVAQVAPVASAEPIFTDPLAGAFTVAVPRGYTMEGSLSDTVPSAMPVWLAAATDDHATVLFAGNMLRLIEPMSIEDSDNDVPDLGSRCMGSCSAPYFRVTTADGTILPEGAEQFAAAYGAKLFAHMCDRAQLTRTRPEPELAQAAKARHGALQDEISGHPVLDRQLGEGPPGWNGGSATFTCNVAGKSYVARVDVVGTTRIERWGPMGDFGQKWTLDSISGFRTPESNADKTEKILAGVNGTIHWNNGWLHRTFAHH